MFPESAAEVAELLHQATHDRTPVTVSGAGTGTVAGRVPFGGVVIATDKLNRIKEIVNDDRVGGYANVEAGAVLRDFQRYVGSDNLLYPPYPTERRYFLGDNVAA